MGKGLNKAFTAAGLFTLGFLLISSAFYKNASIADETAADVILYGNEKCGYCKETRKWLDENRIPYVYRDVELYGTYQEEMYRKLSGAGTARFPVLDVKGQMLIRPSRDDIARALRGEKVSRSEERKQKSPMWRPERKKSLTVKFDSVIRSLAEKDLLVYTDGTAEGKKLVSNLKNEKIPFTLKELNLMGNAAFFDLSSRLADNGYGNTIYFPVAEVRGEFIMKASVEDVRILIIEAVAE